MKKHLKIILLIILILVVSYIVYSFTLSKYFFYSSHIEIQIPIFTKMEERDTHGGFHGDGETFVKAYFTEKQALKFVNKIKMNSHWKELPMPDILEKCATKGIDDDVEIPYIENGYYFFIDRHSQSTNKYEYNEIHNRASWNYSIAVFNRDTNILYYYALDT